MYRTLIGNLRLWTVIPNLSSRNSLRTETGRNKNETESLIGFYKFSVTAKEPLIVEMTEYNGHKYGLLKRDVDYIMSSGSDVYFICDKNGASQIKEMYPEQCVVFFLRIDVKTMIDRMRVRGDDDKSILSREYNAVSNNELDLDYSVHNYSLSKCVDPHEDAMLILSLAGVDE